MKNTRITRFFSLLLCCLMLVGLLPMGQTAYAAGDIEFTTQPQSGTAPKTGSYTFTWEVSGSPVDVVLQEYRISTSEWVNVTSVRGVTSYTVSYNENVSKYRLMASGNAYGSKYYSNEITVTWTGEEAFRFTTQPQSGTAPKTGSHTFTWAFSETPDDAVWQEYRISTSEWVNKYPVTDATSKTVTYSDNVSKYRIMARKGSKTIYSNEVTVTWTGEEGFNFTTQPQSGTAPKTGSHTFTWAFSETPDDATWQEYRISDSDWVNISPVTDATSKTVTYSDNVSKYRIMARKGSKTIYSNEVSVTWTGEEAFRFTTQPQSGTAPKTGSYTFTWALDETPDDAVWQEYWISTSEWVNMYSVTEATSQTVTYNDNVSKYRIMARKGSKTIYSNEVTVTWTDSTSTTRTVTFKDGENVLSTTPVNNGEKVAKPADPTKSGYTFNGWYADATFNIVFDFDQPITADTSVYAKFTPVTVTGISIATPGKTAYTVGEALDVSGMTIKVDYSDGTSATIPVTAAMVSGFDSSAPATSQTLTITYEGKTTTYDVSISDTAPVTYDITVSAGANGTASASAASATAGTTITVTATPDSGYELDKITYTPEGGSETDITSTRSFTMPAAKVTVNASFKASSVTPPVPTTYTVTFKDGENTLSTQTVNEGDKATKPADPTASGWTFGGWYKEAACNNAFNFSTPITGNITLYAKWTKVAGDPVPATKYTITYVLNGGKLDGKTGTVTVSVEDGATITLPKPTRSGYTFDYWEGSRYEAGASYTVTGDHTFTAQWKANSTTGTDGKDTSPKTGDESHIGLWFELMILSLIGLGGVTIYGRKKRTRR